MSHQAAKRVLVVAGLGNGYGTGAAAAYVFSFSPSFSAGLHAVGISFYLYRFLGVCLPKTAIASHLLAEEPR
jgi:hypothetical protein